MARTGNYHSMPEMLILGLLITISLDSTVAQIGVCYGIMGSRLPSPCEVVDLFNQNNIQRMRIYEPHEPTLQALKGSNIELTLGVPNREHLEFVARSQDQANSWVQNNVLNYPDVKFRHIIVGNEVSPINGDTSQYVPFVLPAMKNIYNAISAAGLGDRVKVSTSIDTGVLGTSWPPEDGEFKSEVTPYLNPILQFLMDTGAPLFAHIYPYFAYLNNPTQIDLRYALLDPSYPGVETPYGTRYQNLFYALLDAVYAAIEKSDIATSSFTTNDSDDNLISLLVKGGESGHSTGGKGKLTSVENAETYINNLIQVVKNGSPKRPDEPIETYIFSMFDENEKRGDEDERHFGLFTPDGKPKYNVNFD